MDKILEALVTSSHPLPVKRAIVRKVVEAAEKEVTEEQCQALYVLTTRLILLGKDAFERQTGQQVQESYARYHRDEFARFVSKDFVLGLLQQGYGSLDRRDPMLIDFLHSCLRLLISCPAMLEVAAALQNEVLRIVCERPAPALCSRLAVLLTDFPQCVPREKGHGLLFCQQLVRTMGYFQCTASQENELREYVTQVNRVSALLQGIWKAEPAALLPSLQEVFAIISSTDPAFEPSISLASLVQHIPLQMITVLIKSLTADPNVKDASMTKALCRMIDWLSWPLANHVDTWVIALLKGLASVQKFTILIDVTLLKIELVFSRLWYPIVRQGALVVLSHMLLSFQHSPEAFHLVVPHAVQLVQSVRSDGLPTSKAFLLQFTELIHCMMYQYSGFPDLYDSILEAIKDLPMPSEEKIKLILNQSAWTSQSNLFAPGLMHLPGKSETGKTGLVNLGNTCYMNSVIQTLFMATDFRRHVLSLQLNGSNTLMKKLQLLFAFLAHTQRAAYAPRNFFEASRPPWFTVGSQQDCSEYLRFLLDRLHEEEKAVRALVEAKPKPSETCASDESTASRQAPGAAHTPPASSSAGDEQTLVERMFGGRLSTGIRCLRCHSVSEKEEPFTDLSLAFCPPQVQHSPPRGAFNGSSDSPVVENGRVTRGVGPDTEWQSSSPPSHVGRSRPPVILPELVDYLLAPEILEEENCYFCERCSSLQPAERVVRVVAAPEYLIVTLLRFSYDAARQLRRKILDDVRIPLHMSLPVHQTLKPPPSHQQEAASSCVLPTTNSSDSGENQAKKLKQSQVEEEGDERVDTSTGLGKASVNGEGSMMDRPREDENGTEQRTISYVLTSVVMHSGMSSESGHYYTYGRNMSAVDYEDGSATAVSPSYLSPSNGEQEGLGTSSQSVKASSTSEVEGSHDPSSRDWILFNDSRVTFTTFHSVQNVTSRFPKDTAYVLVYRKQGSGGACEGETNGLKLGVEPPLQKELMDAITKDNKLYLQEQELNARARALQAASASCSFRPNGSDDNEPPGSCGPSGGGGGGGGFNTVSRLVF
ncbi:hypothetical protein ACEWY4_007275 [Coilia grayii]|uniref:USP domain-containing protein n=1 Tax=Coilia grayii TaxID=363190 RepID=A0ABD1KFZ7_9TELE